MVTIDRRTLLAVASVAAIALAVFVALGLGPRDYRAYLAVSGLVAVAMAVSSVSAEPRELLVALVFAVPPVMALTAEGSPSWVIGPLAALLLVGAELNALSWELGGAEAGREAMRARGMSIARVAVAGLVAAMVVVAITRVTLLTETVATVVAAAALLGGVP